METIYIVGTTGSGKTALATHIASRQKSVIISADSRQVYKDMDIVTGKDHPKNVKIHGIDLVDPGSSCSVSVWYENVIPIINQAKQDGLQVIVVGGTGFYVRALTHGIETMSVPINSRLRSQLETLGVNELQRLLKSQDPAKFDRFNHSDQNNPRRLIRAIEVVQSNILINQKEFSDLKPMIALYYKDQDLQVQKIRERVITRLKNGAVTETQNLLNKVDPNAPGLSALGYDQISRFLKGEITEKQLVDDWVNAEVSYTKRQLTYFRKQNVVWYDRGRMSLEEIYEHISS